MKNLKRYLAVLVAVCVMLTAAVPAFAADALTDAEICETIGMIQGSGSGVTPEYLASTPNRMQAARLYLRLLGLEDEALAFGYEGKDNFADADKTIASGKSIMAYLYANPELGWQGGATGNFNPDGVMEAQSYYKVMLEALGYVQGVDFTWSTVFDFAAEVGLTKLAGKTAITMNDVATATVEALKAKVAGSDKTLIEKLVEEGSVDAEAAETAGIYSPVKEITATVKAVGAKKLAVEFNQAVDTTKASFKVTKASIAVNVAKVTWNDAKTVATIELAGQLTEGDYTVETSGLTETALSGKVTVANEKVDKIEFTSSNAVLDYTYANKVRSSFKLYNQYGEDVTKARHASVTFNSGSGTVTTSDDGTLTVEKGSGNFAKDEKLAVSALDTASTTFASTILTVVDKAQVADIVIKGVWNSDGATPKANDGKDYFLKFDAIDQYGNKITDTAVIADGVHVALNTNVTENKGFATADNSTALKFHAKNAGTSTVILLPLSTGRKASYDVVVNENAVVDTITLTAPALAVAGETIEIPFAAVDQFGNAVTDAGVLNGITCQVSGAQFTNDDEAQAFVRDHVKGVTKLLVKADDSAKIINLTLITPKNKIATVTINVQEKAKPVVVAGIKNVSTNIAKQNEVSMNRNDHIVIKDQYGRDFYGMPTGYTLKFATSDGGKVELKSVTNTSVTLFGKDKGTSSITITLVKDGVDVAGSDYTYTAKVVDKADIVSYKLSSIDKVYAAESHGRTVEVKGVLADGTEVVVPEKGLVESGAIEYYKVDLVDGNASTHYSSATRKVYATAGMTGFNNDGIYNSTLVVSVMGANGFETLTGTVTFTNAAPVVDTLRIETYTVSDVEVYTVVDATNLVAAANKADLDSAAEVKTAMASIIKAKDQYGFDIDEGELTVYISNVTDGKAIENIAPGNTFNALAITGNGKTITVKWIVK